MRKYHFPCVVLIILLMSGCVSVRTPSPGRQDFYAMSTKKRQRNLKRIKSWEAKGAFSIQHSPQKPVIAAYDWQQFGNRNSRIRISSSLDIYSAVIWRRPGTVTLQKNREQIYRAKTATQLMQKNLGWSLPINNLSYWIKGAAAPGRSREHADAFGHLLTLWQQGWVINYGAYETVSGIDLPKVIYMSRPGFEAKIVVNTWQIKTLQAKR